MASYKHSSNMGSTELLMIIDAVAREKNISKDAVAEALEEAVRVAARRKYGHEHSIRAEIDKKTGEIRLFREMLVVDPNAPVEEVIEGEPEEEMMIDGKLRRKREINTISFTDAKVKKPDVELGEIILEPLPPIDLGRVAAQSAKQVISYKVREIERMKQYDEFKDKVGDVVSGVVEKIEYGNVIIRIGSTEALLKKEYVMRTDKIKQGDRIRALLFEVNPENKGHQILVSRTHDEFLGALFAQEVPEIYDNIIQIKAIARDPGSRAKIAVHSSDSSIDPVGSCVGMRGARVQAVISELGGERIDIIQWAQDPASLVVNALAPAEVSKVIIDEDNKKIEIVVPEEQLSIAIGKRGQNVRLASKLVGWQLDVLTEASESKRRADEFNAVTEKFMSALDLEEILAQLLASEGYTSIQDIADAEVAELGSIEGLDENIAQELINRAKTYAETHEDAATAPVILAEVSVSRLDKNLLALPNMTEELAGKLYHADIRNLVSLADLSHDEFIEKVASSGLTDEQINKMIMTAREQTFLKDK